MRTHGDQEGSITHWGMLGGNMGGTARGREVGGGETWEEIPDIGDGGWRLRTILPCMYLCYNPA